MSDKKLPQVAKPPFNSHAFNSLAVMGYIHGFHAGNRHIFVKYDDLPILRGSSPVEHLKKEGWRFFVLPENLPEL